MLDQNTDRMWFVIGAVIVGAAIIFIANGTLPDLFASVTESFEEVSISAIAGIENIEEGSFVPIDETFEIIGVTSQDGEPTPDNPIPFQHIKSFQAGRSTVRLKEPLRSNGEVHDRLYLDNDGVWKVDRKIGEMKVDRIASRMRTGNSILRFTIEDSRGLAKIEKSKSLSTHFPYADDTPPYEIDGLRVNQTSLSERVNNGNVGQNHILFLWIESSRLEEPSADAMNEWLKGRNVKVVYELKNYRTDILPDNIQRTMNKALEESR